MKVSDTGGTPTPLTTLDPSRNEQTHGQPSFLPDGRHFLYQRISSSPELSGIYIGSIDATPADQDTRRLLAADVDGVVYATAEPASTRGSILFRRQGSLFAVPFDASRLEITGDPISLSADLPATGAPPFSASTNGVLRI